MTPRQNLLLLSSLIYVLSNPSEANEQITSNGGTSRFDYQPQPRIFSLEPSDQNVEINLDLSVPFISIPLEPKKRNGAPLSLFNVNPKGLAIFGTVALVTSLVVPIFSKIEPENEQYHHQHHHYAKEHKRRDRGTDLWSIDDSMNDILSSNGPVTPCVKRIVCNAVVTASRNGNQSSVDKIIDGLASHKWFKIVTNGTSVEEAITLGRRVADADECDAVYEKCALDRDIVGNLLKIVGL